MTGSELSSEEEQNVRELTPVQFFLPWVGLGKSRAHEETHAGARSLYEGHEYCPLSLPRGGPSSDSSLSPCSRAFRWVVGGLG